MEPVLTIVASAFSPRSWAPFGWVPVEDTDPEDGVNRLEFEWADPHLNVISHSPDEVETSAEGFRCTRMYRHDTHTQVLTVIDHRSVIAVAPPEVRLDDAADAGSVRAFVLRPLDTVVLGRGTWHWGPFPVGDEPVHLLNVQGYGYRSDNTSADLLAAGIDVRVAVTF